MLLLISVVTCMAFLDIAITTILLINGNQWKIFFTSFYNYSFAESFIELWVIGFIRSAIILGGIFGVLCNRLRGPSKCKSFSWIIKGYVYVTIYIALAKLLAFADGSNFFAGPRVYWFWGLFAWTFIGSFGSVLSWHFLSRLKIKKVSVSSQESFMENQPLLQGEKVKSYSNGNFFWFLCQSKLGCMILNDKTCFINKYIYFLIFSY